MKKKLMIVMVILLCVAISSGCSQDEPSPRQDAKNTIVPIDVAGIETLIQERGCPVMLVAMAAWCAPCRAELPVLQEMYEKYKDRGLKIIGVSLDMGGPSAMQPLVDQMGLKFPVYWGGEKVAKHYRISAIPLSYLIKNGAVVESILGRRDKAFIEGKIVALLNECEKERANN